jgi:protein PhnA
MTQLPNCPKCDSQYSYQDGHLYTCPECAHEWSIQQHAGEVDTPSSIIKDANGNQLHDGDTVTVAKDLKVKGSSGSIKVGTKVKNIRLVDGDHNIDCKIDGFGAMKLKSQFVKKA